MPPSGAASISQSNVVSQWTTRGGVIIYAAPLRGRRRLRAGFLGVMTAVLVVVVEPPLQWVACVIVRVELWGAAAQSEW